MNTNDLLLLSGIDIPFVEAGVSIHQPTLQEISFIGEEHFFIGCELLNFSKESLVSEDKNRLQNQTDFDIIMSIIKDKHNVELQKYAKSALSVLVLIFPEYQIEVDFHSIILTLMDNKEDIHKIDNKNFSIFRDILIQMFCIKKDKNSEYNPSGELARKIADKLKKGQQQRNAQTGQQKKISILSRYASILAVGEQKDLNQLMKYTVYQIFDEFQRYQLKLEYDLYLKAKMAGAKDLKEVDNWMEDIHSSSKK